MNGNHVDIYVNVHKGLRNLIGRFSFQTGSMDWTDAAAVSQLHTEWANMMKMIRSHQRHEDRFIHPLLARISPGGHRSYEADHNAQLNMLADLDAHFRRLLEGNHSATRKAEIGLEFYRGLNLFYADLLKHLHREEVEAERILNSLCLPEELMSMMGELLGSIPQDEMLLYIDYMFPAMNLPECVQLLGNIKTGAPAETFMVLANRVRKARGESDWQKIKALLKL
jgi:hypothetical protein